MENRKDIGKAFKDKLENLDKSPSADLWNSIEKDLDKKKKKRILFWFFPSLLIIGLTTSILFFNKNENTVSTKTKEEFESKTKPANSNKIEVVNNDSPSKIAVEKTEANSNNKATKTEATKTTENDYIDEKKDSKTSFDDVKTELQEPKLEKVKSNKNKNNSNSNHSKTRKTETKRLVSETKKTIIYNDNYEEYEVVKKYKIVVKKTSNPYNKTDKNIKNNKKIAPKKSRHKKFSQNKIIEKTTVTKSKNLKEQTSIFLDTVSKKQNLISNKELTNDEFSIINKTDTTKTQKSISIKPEKKLKPKREYKKDSTTTEEEPKREYYATAFYGPTLFGSLNNHSLINPSFDGFSKKHPVPSYYGFYIKSKYKRLGFSIGLSKINLKISNQFNHDQFINNYSNIDFNSTNSVVTINNYFNNSNDIELTQKLSYYETSLAIYYDLLKEDKKTSIDVLTGFSMMTLDENKLYLVSKENKEMEIGSAKNISKLNISFNLGLAFQHKIYKEVYVDLNPIFKYYLSSFNEKSDSRPYSFSIQSGLSYKF